MDRVVSGASSLAGDVLECNVSFIDPLQYCVYHIYKIRSNPLHSLCGALPVLLVSMRITRCVLSTHGTAGFLYLILGEGG